MLDPAEISALAAVDAVAVVADTAAAVRIPSLTGRERPVLEHLAERAVALGLKADLHVHDLARLRTDPGHPGEEAPRDELVGLAITLSGGRPGRVCLCGHVDVVPAGTETWRHGPWSGEVADRWVHGRGSADMKGGVIAALHALAALRASGAADRAPTVVLECVASEEDGGLGAFAALERDAAYDACLIPEPTGFEVICAQAGSLTFEGVVTGRGAHAAHRLEGRSALDRYIPVHQALQAHERAVNAGVAHAAMQAVELPYPLVVGRVTAGAWSSSVPDRLEFEGRLGVPVGVEPAAARAAFEAAVRDADAGEQPPIEISWTGGAFAPGETDPDHPWVRAVQGAVGDELGRPARIGGVPWGADMRLFCARGIPTTMVGTHGIRLAHSVDERVRTDELITLSRALTRAILRFPAME